MYNMLPAGGRSTCPAYGFPPSPVYLSFYLPFSLYIYSQLFQAPKTCEPDNLYGWQQTLHPSLPPTTWQMEPCHDGERWSPCRELALGAQISPIPTGLHQKSAIRMFYCIKGTVYSLKKNENCVNLLTTNPLSYCCGKYTKENILKNIWHFFFIVVLDCNYIDKIVCQKYFLKHFSK